MNFNTEINDYMLGELKYAGCNLGKNNVILEKHETITYNLDDVESRYVPYLKRKVESYIEEVETKNIYKIEYTYLATSKTDIIDSIKYSLIGRDNGDIKEMILDIYRDFKYDKFITIDNSITIKILDGYETEEYRVEKSLFYNR